MTVSRLKLVPMTPHVLSPLHLSSSSIPAPGRSGTKSTKPTKNVDFALFSQLIHPLTVTSFVISAEVELAVKHAEAAWPAWAATPAVFRAAALRQYGELINTYAEEFIDVESRPIGKVSTLTRGLPSQW